MKQDQAAAFARHFDRPIAEARVDGSPPWRMNPQGTLQAAGRRTP